jgi:DNA-binding CsgD family transcriptional regulator
VELAAELGCSHKTVLRYLDAFGVPVRDRSARRSRYPGLQSSSFLHTAYVVQGRTAADIADELGCSRPSVIAALRAHGIRRFRTGRRAPSRDFLVRAYAIQGRSTVDIAAELGCGASTVARHLRRHGIAVRGRGGPVRG